MPTLPDSTAGSDEGTVSVLGEFLIEVWQAYRDNIILINPYVYIDAQAPSEIIASLTAGEYASSLNLIHLAASGVLSHNANTVSAVRRACQRLTDVLYGIMPVPYTVPDSFSTTPIGVIWWQALLWCERDELITLSEAASLIGVTVQAISSSRKLSFFVNPTQKGRAGRRLVRRSEVLALRGQGDMV